MESSEVYTYIEDPTLSEEATILPLAIPQMVMVNMVSMGLYSFYWFYRNWKDMDIWDIDHRPGLKTFGLFIPLVNLVIVYRFFKRISESVRDEVARRVSPFLMTFLFHTSLLIGYKGEKWGLGDGLSTLFSVGVLTFVLYLSQQAIVAYWRERGEGMRTRLRLGEKILVAVGVLLWVLMLLPA